MFTLYRIDVCSVSKIFRSRNCFNKSSVLVSTEALSGYTFCNAPFHCPIECEHCLKYLCISEKSDTRSLCTCYLKVVEGEISLMTLPGTLRVYISSSFFRYFDGHHKSTFKELWDNLLHRFFSFLNMESLGMFT